MNEFLLKTDIDEIVTRLKPHAADIEGRTVLVTGGRGFLGRYFTEVFAALNTSVLETPVRVLLLDNLIAAGNAGSYGDTRSRDHGHTQHVGTGSAARFAFHFFFFQ